MGMSTEENKALVRRYTEVVVNTGNLDDIATFIAPDYVEVYNNVRHELGIDGAREHILGVRRTYRDLHVTIEQQIAEGDWVVSRITARGTHQGAWMGIAPTGKKVEITGVNINRIVNGRIVEHGGAANLLEPLLEIGAIQVTGADG
jgi:predicted ester cyclase